MADRQKPAYYAVIPADVRYDDRIPPNAKLLYGEVSALCNSEGICTAGNEYFAEIYGMTDRTIRGLIRALDDAGYVRTEILRNAEGQIEGRNIYLASAYASKILNSLQEGSAQASGKSFPEASGKSFPVYIMKNNNISPPKPPQGGEGPEKLKRRRSDYKPHADVLPERFDRFWEFYRLHCPPDSNPGNRQKAIRAWDKLAPSDELTTTMAKALSKQVHSAAWTKGVGVPHASTWINNHGWEDDWGTPAPDTQADGSAGEEAAEWVN